MKSEENSIKLKWLKNPNAERDMRRKMLKHALELLVYHGVYKSTGSAYVSIRNKVKKL